jgi:hypothetical protein
VGLGITRSFAVSLDPWLHLSCMHCIYCFWNRVVKINVSTIFCFSVRRMLKDNRVVVRTHVSYFRGFGLESRPVNCLS